MANVASGATTTPSGVASGPEGANTAGSGRQPMQWVASHQAAATLVAFALVLLYVLPLLLITASAIHTDGFEEPDWLFSWFAAFMKSSDATLGGVHKVLFPFLSTLSIVAFRDRFNYWVIALGIFVLCMFMLTVGIGVMFEINKTADAISALGQPVDLTVARAFFSKVQDTLLMYLMLLLGVSAVSEPAKK